MTVTEWAAWIGACSGLGSFAWNVYTKLTSGPKLRVTALAGMVKIPPPPDNPRVLKVTVQNVGTAPTTITNLTLHSYDSWWTKFRSRATLNAVVVDYQGPQLPHKLEVGAEWCGLMTQDKRFDDWLRSDRLWCAVFHAFSKTPTQVKILNLSSKT